MKKLISLSMFFILNLQCANPDVDQAEMTDFKLCTLDQVKRISKQEYQEILELHKDLNNSLLLNNKILNNKKALKESLQDYGVKKIEIKTEDDCFISCAYLNRGKSKVIIAAPGFGGGIEQMAPCIDIFSDYDVFIIDYWGHGLNKAQDNKSAWYRNPARRFFSQRFEREHYDLLAAINYLRDNHNYDEFIGCANCYSTYIFSKVQAQADKNEAKAFDKLILDSCWLSMQSVAEKIALDPYLSFDQINGGSPRFLKHLMSNDVLSKSIIRITEFIFGMDFKDFSILSYIKDVKCPILFIQGSKDLLTNKHEFQVIWNQTKAPQILLKTPCRHSISCLQAKEVFKFISNEFIEGRLAF